MSWISVISGADDKSFSLFSWHAWSAHCLGWLIAFVSIGSSLVSTHKDNKELIRSRIEFYPNVSSQERDVFHMSVQVLPVAQSNVQTINYSPWVSENIAGLLCWGSLGSQPYFIKLCTLTLSLPRDRYISGWMTAAPYSSLVNVKQETLSVNQAYVWPRRSLYLSSHWASKGSGSLDDMPGRGVTLLSPCHGVEGPSWAGFYLLLYRTFSFTREYSWATPTWRFEASAHS